MYEYIDKNLEKYRKQIQRLFNNSRLRISARYSPETLEKVSTAEIKKLLKKLKQKDHDFFWLMLFYILALPEDADLEYELRELDFDFSAFLASYNATTRYVYKNETQRKSARYNEGIIALNNPSGDDTYQLMKDNIRYWVKQCEEISVDMEREVVIKQAEKAGYKKMRWDAVGDEKTCKECRKLNGQIFDIADIPPRPHYGCRCILTTIDD